MAKVKENCCKFNQGQLLQIEIQMQHNIFSNKITYN